MLGAIVGDIEEAAYAYLDEPLKDVFKKMEEICEEWRIMDEVVDLLNEILDELRTMNEKLDDIRGNEYDDGSLEDIFDKLDEINDNIGWN